MTACWLRLGELLSEDVEPPVTVERGLLFDKLPAFFGFGVEEHLKAALAAGVVESVSRAELLDAVLPLGRHEGQEYRSAI